MCFFRTEDERKAYNAPNGQTRTFTSLRKQYPKNAIDVDIDMMSFDANQAEKMREVLHKV